MAVKAAPAQLAFPRLSVKDWVVLGVDLSFSRTGFATLRLEGGVATWGEVGSIAPKSAKDETWARGTAIARHLRDLLRRLVAEAKGKDTPTGVILSMETPDPNNSYLMALNGIVQSQLWGTKGSTPYYEGADLYRMLINAATLRSALRLPGAKTDKDENKAMAYQYIDVADYPGLDSDSCDAVLLAMMGKHAAMILIGQEAMVPNKCLFTLCSEDVKVKVTTRSGVSSRKETPKAIMHNPATWTHMGHPIQIIAGLSTARNTSNATPTTFMM